MKAGLNIVLNRFKSAPKSVRIFTYLLLTYAFYALLIGLVLPALIQSQAPKKLGEILGRDVTIEQVKINPFLLRVQVDNVVVMEKENDTAIFAKVAQTQLEINFWQSVLSLTPTLEYFSVHQPNVNIIRRSQNASESVFNFSDIIEHLAKEQAVQDENSQAKAEIEEPKSNQIFALKIGNISLMQGQVAFEDNKTGASLGYQGMNISLKEFDSRALTLTLEEKVATKPQDQQINAMANLYSMSMTGIDQSEFKLDGQFQLKPFELQANVSLSDLKLVPFWPLSEKVIEAELAKGQISVSSLFSVKQNKEQFDVETKQGHLLLKDVEFVHDKSAKVKLQKFELLNVAANTNNQTVNLENTILEGLWVDGVLGKNGFDLQKQFTPKTKPTASESTSQNVEKSNSGLSEIDNTNGNSESKTWLVYLDQVSMNETDINMKEELVSGGVRWRVYPFNLSTGKIISDLSKPIDYQMDLAISSDNKSQPKGSRGRLESSGVVDATALTMDSLVKLVALDLSQLQPYIDPYANVVLSSGLFSTEGKLKANSKGKVFYDGKLALGKLSINDVLQKEPILKWENMSVNSIKFAQSDNSLTIDTVVLNAPYAKVIIAEDKQTNLGAVSKSESRQLEDSTSTESSKQIQSSPAKKSAPTNENEFGVDIANIEIVDGSAFFADFSLTPNFASGIEFLKGHIKNVSSKPGTKALVDITGKVDKYAPVSLKGEVNPLIESPYLDLDFSLKSAELTSVNPYSGTYAGYYIDKGQVSIDINYRLEDNQLTGINHVVVDQLTFGKSVESTLATSLPVTLAVGLLQDSDGVIDLGFDVAGDVDSPEFSFGGIILKAFVNIITKAITAPFSLLADLVGSDEELNFVQFEAGVSTLDSQAESRLSKLIEALQSRPNLRISVEGSVLLADDSRALAEIRLHQKLLETSGIAELPSDLSASRVPALGPLPEALAALFTKELGLDVNEERSKVELKLAEAEPTAEISPEQVNTTLNIGLYNQLLNAQTISQSDLGRLAETRARSVKAFLVENEIDPGRVFILDSKTDLKTEHSQALMTIDAG